MVQLPSECRVRPSRAAMRSVLAKSDEESDEESGEGRLRGCRAPREAMLSPRATSDEESGVERQRQLLASKPAKNEPISAVRGQAASMRAQSRASPPPLRPAIPCDALPLDLSKAKRCSLRTD